MVGQSNGQQPKVTNIIEIMFVLIVSNLHKNLRYYQTCSISTLITKGKNNLLTEEPNEITSETKLSEICVYILVKQPLNCLCECCAIKNYG